jgi:hypothetical protein
VSGSQPKLESLGLKLGAFGFVLEFTPVKLFLGVAQTYEAGIEYKKQEIIESSNNPRINPNVYRGPDH